MADLCTARTDKLLVEAIKYGLQVAQAPQHRCKRAVPRDGGLSVVLPFQPKMFTKRSCCSSFLCFARVLLTVERFSNV
eukprot:5196593-Amphidinium_carterae.1